MYEDQEILHWEIENSKLNTLNKFSSVVFIKVIGFPMMAVHKYMKTNKDFKECLYILSRSTLSSTARRSYEKSIKDFKEKLDIMSDKDLQSFILGV